MGDFLKCTCVAFLAGTIIGTGAIITGRQSKNLSLLLSVTGFSGIAGCVSTLIIQNSENSTKKRILAGVEKLKIYYASNPDDLNKLVKISQIEEEIWTL